MKELFKGDEFFSDIVFLSEEQFKKILILYHDFIKEVNKIEAEENSIKSEKPFYVFTLGLPLKKVIEEINKTS